MQRNPVDGHCRTSLASPGEQPLRPTLAQATRCVPKRKMSRMTLWAGIWQQGHKPSVEIPAKTHANTNGSRRTRGSHIHCCGCITDIRQSGHQSFFKDLRAVEARHPSWRGFPCIRVRGAHTSDRRPSSIEMPISPTESTSVLPNLFAKLRLRVSARQPHREARPHSAGVLLPDGLRRRVCCWDGRRLSIFF